MAQAARMNRIRDSLPEVKALERFNRLKGEFAKIVEGFQDGFTIERRSWSEAYAKGRISLIVYYDRGAEGLRGGVSFAAGEVGPLNSLSALVFKLNTNPMCLVDGGQQEAMLVDTVKLRKFPEQKLSSVVRLYRIEDERRQGGITSLYRSVMGGLTYYVVPRFAHGECHPINLGNRNHDVVEGNPEIVDRIPYDERDDWWKLDVRNLGPLTTGLQIILDDKSCEIRLEKGAVLIDKAVDVALGPISL